ncbi:glutamyl-tRNA reductase [Paradesulfitobacterium ferrireducens]|uniref:glutamyl-tRNA reductase n=1 Tax=Paradesulfitobacterium ferrireducens TaxID=2816476 RepID=UPI001A8FE0DF|nr:glutamyl-tRNA reductase [Paradesulfitobacterium ferrireducens]
MFPVTVGLSHHSAPLEIREKLAFPASEINNALQELIAYPALEGIVILSTCNRLEIYAATTDIEIGQDAIKKFLYERSGLSADELNRYLYSRTLYEAVRHLFNVVSGFDSMVLGETQILGQVAQAYEDAYAAGVTNKVINVFFQNALTVGKRVRTETKIDQHPVSISYTAVELAMQKFPNLKGKTIMILGAGEMSYLTAKHLVAAGASTVLVSNRSYDRALSLAAEFNGRAVRFDEMDAYLGEVDIIISATASVHYVLLPERVEKIMRARAGRALLIIDIAVPRDVHPEVGSIPGVTLHDIDDLQGVVDRSLQARESAAVQGKKIIEEEMKHFLKWHNSLFVIPTIVALKQRAEEIKEVQLSRALERLGTLTPKQEKAIRSLANSIVNQLLHAPITNLKEFADTRQGHLYTEILQNLFDLSVEEETKSLWMVGQQPGQALRGRVE